MKKFKVILMIIMFCFILNIDSVKATEELPDNGAKISSSVVTQTKTGTGPFDENDDPGNDSSEDNNVVRSFDQVTWTIENTMILNNSETDSYTGGRIYFEATLPDVFTSETVKWDLDSMAWIENAKVSSNGLTLTGYYQLGTENITVPGKQTLVFVTKILGEKNGTEFQPTIKLWLNGNNEEDYKNVIPEKITVSAAPSYNIKFVRNTNLYKRALGLNYDGQIIDGRAYGYAFILQLYNKDVSKGLKGIEYPKGDITFDIDLKFERTDLGSTRREDITDECTPLLWNYKVNNKSQIIKNRSMNFGAGNENARWFAPLGGGNSDRKKTVYNSGNINIVQNGSKLSVTVSDYSFDGNFPIYNNEYGISAGVVYKENVGCFSVGYFQIIIPDNEASIQKNSNFYLTVKDSNFKATSVSDQNTNIQAVTTDDSNALTHVRFSKGSFNNFIYFYNTSNVMLHSQWNMGDSIVFKGQKFIARSYIQLNRNNDPDDYIRAIDRFFKFDGNAFEITNYNNDQIFYFSSGLNNMKWKYWFVTKKDGTNWSSQTDMNNGNIEDMVLYENLSDIPDGNLCVGVYFESQGGYLNLGDHYFNICLRVKDTATIGQTYATTQTSRYWREELDRNIYSQQILDSYDSYPQAAYVSKNMKYIKTEYNESGTIISGTHSGGAYYGQTALVVGAQQGISQMPIDEAGNEKINYDLGRNENVVTYKITPTLTSYGNIQSNIKDVAITITDTLPNGLTYVPNSSNYGEPQLTKNADGTTTLVWQITGCNVDEKIDDLLFKASIYEETPNGTQYENKAVISAEQDKIGNTTIRKRTSTSTIQIINLSSHRLYKTVETPVIEKNGEIHFTVSYKNNTDEIIPDFQMLDILPYNGDNRGTNYTGEYTLDRLVVTQKDGSDKIISNDSLEILYTNDEGVRSGVTSKDENLGEGWSIADSETIKQKATAYVVKGEVGTQGSVTVDVYLKTNGNKGLDKYVNSATAQVYKETEEIITSNVTSQVVERSIEGIAWEDSNRNGVKDEEEKVLSNVEIKLTDELGQQVTDVNGNKVTSVKTDSNGYYKFENLPKGEYYVQVVVPSEKYELTEKQVGTNNEINSKFNEEEKETDKITGLNSIDLPELKVSNVNAGFVKIEGSIEITKVDGKDNSKVIEGATFKVEKIDESGNIDNTFEANELTTGKDGKVIFEKLEVGKYRVTETKAPSGYELLENSIEVEITGEKRDIKLVAENELKLELPETGSINYAIILGVVGIGIIVIAIVLNKKYKVINIKK